LTCTAITATIDHRSSSKNSKGINNGSFLCVKGIPDVRRFRSSISDPFSLLQGKHAPAMFQQRRNLFFFMSQFCHRLYVTMAHNMEIWREMGRTVLRTFVVPIYRSPPDHGG